MENQNKYSEFEIAKTIGLFDEWNRDIARSMANRTKHMVEYANLVSPKHIYGKDELINILKGYNIITVTVDGKDFRFYRSGHPSLCPSEVFCEDSGGFIGGVSGIEEAEKIANKIVTLQKYCASCQISVSYVDGDYKEV